MTLSFLPDMSAGAFIVDGLDRYLKELGGEEFAERVLHPERIRMLSDELGSTTCWRQVRPVQLQ